MYKIYEGPVDAAHVVACLEAATATLLAMPPGGHSTGLAQSRQDVVHEFMEAYGRDNDARNRLGRRPIPKASAISAMDVVLGWPKLLENKAFRRIVALRSLTNPANAKPKSWRSIARIVGADHKAVKRWHEIAIAQLTRKLNAMDRPMVPALED